MRLRNRFAALAAEGKKALVIYLTYGDPRPEASAAIVRAIAEAGADAVELGVPFSDPNADGPVIQAAMQRALAAGATPAGALSCVRALRDEGLAVPVVLFGYYNPIFVRGPVAFARDAAAAGVDAVLTVDLPIDELAELAVPLAAEKLDVVPLLAPTSTPGRIARVREFSPPFIYYISMTGVTGAAFRGSAGGAERIAEIRAAAGAPVCVGFGVKTAADAQAVAALADGVVVGSAVIERIAGASGDPAGAVGDFVAELRRGIDEVTVGRA